MVNFYSTIHEIYVYFDLFQVSRISCAVRVWNIWWQCAGNMENITQASGQLSFRGRWYVILFGLLLCDAAISQENKIGDITLGG